MADTDIRRQPVFRVFISSTFSDFREERDCLQAKVFPRLEAYCRAHGALFQAVDLRWGISDEASLDHRTVDICLSEIRQCKSISPRPSLLILIGDRYGWRPPPNRIPAETFRALNPTPLLKEWYRLDENDGAGHWLLRPRSGADRDADVWARTEASLRTDYETCLTTAGRKLRQDPPLAATDQEIRLGLEDTRENLRHIDCYLRRFTNLPETAEALPFLDGALENGRFVRDGKAADRLEALKAFIREKLDRANVLERQVDFSRRSEAMGAFCEDVYRLLMHSVESEMARITRVDVMAEARRIEAEFGARAATPFVGQAELMETLWRHLRGGSHSAVLYGASGKSAVCAALAQRLGPSRAVIRHVGRSLLSANANALLAGILRELGLPTAGDDERQLQTLARSLRKSRKVLILDGLDRLPEPARLFKPLCGLRNVVVACDTRLLADAFSLPTAYPIPALTEAERFQLFDGILVSRGRSLRPGQREVFQQRLSQNESPIYCRLAAERAALLHSFDAAQIAPDAEGVTAEIVADLTQRHSHKPTLVRHMLALIGAARTGVTFASLSDMLLSDREVFEEFRVNLYHPLNREQLPTVIWTRLYYDLTPYLTFSWRFGEEILSFAYDSFRLYARRECVFPEMLALARAHYQQDAADPGSMTPQGLSELPYLLLSYGSVSAYLDVACNATVLRRRLESGLTHELWDELKMAVREGNPEAGCLSRFLSAHINELQERPQLTANLLYAGIARAAGHGQPGAENLLGRLSAPSFMPAAQQGGPQNANETELLALNEFGREETGWSFLNFLPDGQRLLAMSVDGSFALCSLENGTMEASRSPDRLDQPYFYGAVADADTLFAQSQSTLCRLVAPNYSENGFRFSAWHTIDAGRVTFDALSPEGPVISAQMATAKKVKIWKLVTYGSGGNVLKTQPVNFVYMPSDINRIAHSSDGDVAIAFMGGAVAASTGLRFESFGSAAFMDCVFYDYDQKVAACTSDGQLLLFDGCDSCIDSASVKIPGSLEQHCECLLLDEGRNALIVGHRNGYLTFYGLEDGQTQRVFPGMRGGILSMALSENGEYLALGGRGGNKSRIRVYRVQDLLDAARNRMALFANQPCGDYAVAGRFLPNGFLFLAEFRARKDNQRQILCLFRGADARLNPFSFHSAGSVDVCAATGALAFGLGNAAYFAPTPRDARQVCYRGKDGIAGVAFSPDGQRIAVAEGKTLAIVRREGETWRIERQIPLQNVAGKSPAPMAFDGDRVAVVTEPAQIRVPVKLRASSPQKIYRPPVYHLCVFEVDTGREYCRIPYRGYMSCVRLTPRGLLYTLGQRTLYTRFFGENYTLRHAAEIGLYRYDLREKRSEKLADGEMNCGCCTADGALFFAGLTSGEIACVPTERPQDAEWLSIPGVPCEMTYDSRTRELIVMDNGETCEGIPRVYPFTYDRMEESP